MTQGIPTATGADAQFADMTDRTFGDIVKLARSEAGLMITETKRALVQSRVSRRLRALGISEFGTYIDFIKSGEDPSELSNMISVLTTNVSSFFRENHHFETLSKELLPQLIEEARKGNRVRIWSAGCSSGQEPYTVAMLILSQEPRAASYDIKILASDIDTQILAQARAGIYDDAQLEGIDRTFRSRYFSKSAERPDYSEVASELKSLITFRELNLLRDWPMRGPFQAVFCRNVVIYFDEETQRKLWPKFRALLPQGGTMFLGHSERIPDPQSFGFDATGITTYRAT